MAAANASARGQRAAILASPLHQLTGFYLAADCRSTGCGGERAFAVAELAAFYKDRTVGEVLRLMRCAREVAPAESASAHMKRHILFGNILFGNGSGSGGIPTRFFAGCLSVRRLTAQSSPTTAELRGTEPE